MDDCTVLCFSFFETKKRLEEVFFLRNHRNVVSKRVDQNVRLKSQMEPKGPNLWPKPHVKTQKFKSLTKTQRFKSLTKPPDQTPKTKPQTKTPDQNPKSKPQTKTPNQNPRPKPQIKTPDQNPRPKPQTKTPNQNPNFMRDALCIASLSYHIL